MGKTAETDQRTRFIEAARELGCDEDEAAFKRTLGRVAQHKRKGDALEPPKEPRED